MPKSKVFPGPLRSRIGAVLTANFEPINPGGFIAPVFYMRINNTTNRDVFLSFDGVTEHEFLVAGQVFEIYAQSNAEPNNYVALFAERQIIYVKTNGGAGNGAIYVSSYLLER